AIVDSVSAVIGLGSAVVAALLGAGYWSLLVAPLAGGLVSLLGGWVSSRWLPGPPALRLPDRSVLGFGLNLSGFTLVNYLARNLDNVLIGRSWGPVGLGFYDRAYTLLM